MKRIWKDFKHIIESCYLCLKYPFLYPRNRFTGKHVVNVLARPIHKLHIKSVQQISITGELTKEIKTYYRNKVFFLNYVVSLNSNDKTITIGNGTDVKTCCLKRLLWNDDRFDILGIDLVFGMFGNPIIKVIVKPKDSTDTANYAFCYEQKELVINKFIYFWYKVLCWIDEKILDRILFIPTYTELDAMPTGWRKAFGLQMCEEIKQALLKHGRSYLRDYRIVQIKEKFARLCWYDANSVLEVWDIIEKYEGMSYITCIDCGKPATKYSTGWICPYCDDCYKTP